MALDPAKSLLFALVIVVEAAITRQLIACVAVVNSGIQYIYNGSKLAPSPQVPTGVEHKLQCRGSNAAGLDIEVDSNA
jgi:hypothetical protein